MITLDIGKSQIVIYSSDETETVILLDNEIRNGIVDMTPDEAMDVAIAILQEVQDVLNL